jgi:hypothetical protein
MTMINPILSDAVIHKDISYVVENQMHFKTDDSIASKSEEPVVNNRNKMTGTDLTLYYI